MPYDVTITRLETQALFDLKGPAAALGDWAGETLPALPDRPNTKTRHGSVTVQFLGPDHWLLRAALETEDALIAALRPDDAPPDISIVRVSDTLAFFRITGPDAPDILAIGCPLDLHERRFGPEAATFTEVFGLRALVTRCEEGFDVAVDRSYGTMVADCLDRAAA